MLDRTSASGLQDKIGELIETIRQMQDAWSPPGLLFPAEWKLQPAEAAIIRALIAQPRIASEQHAFIRKDDGGKRRGKSAKGVISVGSFSATLCRVRKILKDKGIKIQNEHSTGWMLSSDDRKKLLAICADEMKRRDLSHDVQSVLQLHRDSGVTIERLIKEVERLRELANDLNTRLLDIKKLEAELRYWKDKYARAA